MLTTKNYEFLMNFAKFDEGSSLLEDHGYKFFLDPNNIKFTFYYLPVSGKSIFDCPLVEFNSIYNAWIVRRFE